MTPDQIFEAARLWNLAMDTRAIADRLRIPEAWVYGRIGAVKAAAMAQRNAQRMVSA